MMYGKVIALCFGLLLAGCGFHPLYGDKTELLEQTAAVQVQPIAGEGGYQMEMILKDRLNPNHQHVQQKYRLSVTLEKPTYVDQSIRSDNFASLESMNIRVFYQLTDAEKNTVLINSSVDSNGMFNLIKDPYATVVAQDKLYDNLIRLMADDIATHVLSYFSGE